MQLRVAGLRVSSQTLSAIQRQATVGCLPSMAGLGTGPVHWAAAGLGTVQSELDRLVKSCVRMGLPFAVEVL